MMIITENPLLIRYFWSLFIFLVLFFPQICHCVSNPHICSPSACGNIRNISYPFRLKHDPKKCGSPKFELECENNVSTILYLNSQKYKVKAIDYFDGGYLDGTMWLADDSVNKNNICSFPFPVPVPLSLHNYFILDYRYYLSDNHNNTPISLMRCPYGLKNDPLMLTELPPDCVPSNSTTHTYIKVDHMKASDVRDMCTVESIGLTSWNFKELKNVSLSEIHNSLLYGFQLSWDGFPGSIWCNGRMKVARYIGDKVTCSHGLSATLEAVWDKIKDPYYIYPEEYVSGPITVLIVFLLLILVVVFAGVTLPAKIILVFTSAFVFIIIQMVHPNRQHLNLFWPVEHVRIIVGAFFAVRFITVFPFIIWLFIYKFRRRHLSRFAAIEDFLHENNLMPIRYSYSDIKEITKGFREKLGQGGYGTVYKGKLRSGYDVAVKLLGKPGGNGQDFMNEIATIGRIHHVNVVKLVGYCAERSKRALVFDFMPNGSLDKYLYSREEMNCLSWEKKYKIAIEIARGIEYLHKGCDIQILHFDIKPHNILLDDNFTPKISDFGLAKFFSTDKKVVTMTAIRGTVGYVAPELINRGFGEVSYKADVYSFGMLLIEMVGLNKELRRNNQASSQYFPDWIYDSFEQGHDIEVTDENDDDNNNDTNKKIVKKMTIVALWCIQMSPGDRPSMNKVVKMLEAQVERLQIPNRPSELAQVVTTYEDTYSTGSTSLLSHDVAPSVEITIED